METGKYNTTDIVHFGPPPEHKPDVPVKVWQRQYCDSLLSKFYSDPRLVTKDHKPAENSNHLLVIDRFHIGSAVYGHLYRPEYDEDGYGDIGADCFYELDYKLARAGGTTAFLLPTIETIFKRSQGRTDEYLDTVDGATNREVQLTKIQNRYMSIFRDLRAGLPSMLDYPLYATQVDTARQIDLAPRENFFPPSEFARPDNQMVLINDDFDWPIASYEQDKNILATLLINIAWIRQQKVASL